MTTISLDGQTGAYYEIETLTDRFGIQEWVRTGHGFFVDLDEARQVASGMDSFYQARIAQIEIKRTVVE